MRMILIIKKKKNCLEQMDHFGPIAIILDWLQ